MNSRTDLRRAAPWALCALSLAIIALSVWLRWTADDQRPAEHVAWDGALIEALGFAGIPVVGALIASRLPANPYGWVWCATGLAYGVGAVSGPLVDAVGGPRWLAWVLAGWGFASLIGLLVFVFLLFPTGRLPSYRWRWIARAAVVGSGSVMLLVLFITDPENASSAGPWVVHGSAGRYLEAAAIAGVYAMFGLALVAMSSLVLRFRVTGPVERRQLAWFLYATAVNAVILVLDSVLGVLPTSLLTTAVSSAGFALLPVAVGIAVLRYRLFEIDRIVSRTVSYGLLSAALVALYLVVVALLRPLLEPLTGSSALAVAGSTLAVAAAFNPARRRLQAAVDRRFDRARYDAVRAVDAFTARLRDQVDLDEITIGLRDTVEGTVAPTSIGVWLRGPAGLRKG